MNNRNTMTRTTFMKPTSPSNPFRGLLFTRAYRHCVLLAICVAALGTLQESQAQIAYWTGVNGSNWSGGVGGENWSSTAASPAIPVEPVNGNSLEWRSNFGINKVSNNDMTNLSVVNIVMTNGNPTGIEISGNPLTLTGDVSDGTGKNKIKLGLELNTATATAQFSSGTGGDLIIEGIISEAGGSRNIRIGNNSPGNNSTVTLSGNNTFSGTVTLGFINASGTANINTLRNIGVSQSLGTGSLIQFGFRAATGTVIYTGGGTSTDKQWVLGENSGLSGRTGGGAFINNGSGAVVWSGAQTPHGQPNVIRNFTLGGTNSDNNTWQSAIQNNSSGNVSFTKTDAGKWILGGTNTYTGATSVQQGVLLVDGSTAASSAVSVSLGAVFGGNGTVNGNLTLASGALFAFDTGSTLDLIGTLSIDPLFDVASLRNKSGGAVPWANVPQGTYTLMNTSFVFNDTNIRNFGEVNRATNLAGGRSAYFQQGSSPSSLQLVVVPEPTTLGLTALGMGLAGVACWRRRRS
jgi:autotransporter-associated beta strand protein